MLLETTNGPCFEVDAKDYARTSQYKWHFQRYVRATVNTKIVRLHNFLFGYAPPGLEWDHIDRNTLNNKRSNLRLVTHSVNMRNKRLPSNNSSGTKGVCWHKGMSKWIAQFKLNGRIKHLGYFECKEDAIKARQTAEKTHLNAS